MDPRTAYARRAELQILDVREDEEWAAGRIDGALHIPLGQLAARMGELTRTQPTQPLATVCRSGGRSSTAVKVLASAGLAAESIDGGMTRWAKDGLPFTTPDGRPGRVA